VSPNGANCGLNFVFSMIYSRPWWRDMGEPVSAQERLRELYSLLGELLDLPAEEVQETGVPWYAPQLPPLDVGSKLSATDLLNWWFRPAVGKNAWDKYFASATTLATRTERPQETLSKQHASAGDGARLSSSTAMAALLPKADDELANQDADTAVEVFYEFLHAFGRGDIRSAMTWVADDYHVMEEDVEVDRNGLERRLEWLLETLHGWDFEVSLASILEPVPHAYGIMMYAEIQINGVRPLDHVKRCLVERRVVLLENSGESDWKIAAMSRPRI
jgi:hypothetical protein